MKKTPETVSGNPVPQGYSLRGWIRSLTLVADVPANYVCEGLTKIGEGAEVEVFGPKYIGEDRVPYVIKKPIGGANYTETVSGLVTSCLIDGPPTAMIYGNDNQVLLIEPAVDMKLSTRNKDGAERPGYINNMLGDLSHKLSYYHKSGRIIYDIKNDQIMANQDDLTWKFIDKSMGFVWPVSSWQTERCLELINEGIKNRDLITKLSAGIKKPTIDRALKAYDKIPQDTTAIKSLATDKEGFNNLIDNLVDVSRSLVKLGVFDNDPEAGGNLESMKRTFEGLYGQTGAIEDFLDVFRGLFGGTTSLEEVGINANKLGRSFDKYIKVIKQGIDILKLYKEFSKGGLSAMSDIITDQIAQTLGFGDRKCDSIVFEKNASNGEAKTITLPPPRFVCLNWDRRPQDDYRGMLDKMNTQIKDTACAPGQSETTFNTFLSELNRSYWRLCALDQETLFEEVATKTIVAGFPQAEFSKKFEVTGELIKARITRLKEMAESGTVNQDEFFGIEDEVTRLYES